MMKFLNFLQFCYEASISFALENGQLKVKAPQGTLTTDVVQRLRQFKPELLEFLQTSAANEHAPTQQFEHILPVTRSENLPVSYGQEQLWLAQQKDDDVGDAYHFVRILELTGELGLEALNATFTEIFQRHEALRTVFVARDEELLQTILPAPTIDIPVADLLSVDEPQRGVAVSALHRKLASTPFDLTCDLMLRLHLIRLDWHRHQLVIVLHHIASDGWSLGILVNEFQTLYTQFVQDIVPSLVQLPIQYADYAHWERAPRQLEAVAASLEYWTKRMEGAPELHALLTDRPRPVQQSFKGNCVYTRFDAATTRALKQLAQRAGSTLFMVLETMFAGLIASYSRSDDVVIGTPVANRPHQDVEGLIGYFINMLALRHYVDDNASMLVLIEQAKQDIVAAFSHNHVPFDQVVRAVTTTRSTSYNPLIQIVFVLQNNDIADLSLPGVACTIHQMGHVNALFDLKLEARETGAELQLCWEYASDLFLESTLERMAHGFEQLAHAVLADPDMPLNRLVLVNEAERHQLLVEWNDTATIYPSDKCIHELFEAQVTQNPDVVAVVYEGEQLSYGELNAKANQLAHYLVTEKQVRPDTLVGICIERSLEMVIGILGILKAGGAYVPLDPDYPQARLEYMLEDANLTTVLTQSHLLDRTPVSAAQTVCMDDAGVQQVLAKLPVENIVPKSLGLQSHHLAYVIYTSGSTGNPKGVMIGHQGLVNLACWLGKRYTLGPDDKVLQFAPVSFDMSVEEIFGALCSGSTLVVRAVDWIESVARFWQCCAAAGVTVLNLPTAFWHELAHDKAALPAASVRHVSIGGENVSETAIEAWYAKPGALPTLLNAYGPTECTVNVSTAELLPGNRNSIGQGLDNTSLFVLSEQGLLPPVGVAGELHLGGIGLARGYLNRPELTAEKFIVNPFYNANDPSSSERLYKTGDLVRWLADGNLEFLGRIDHQVKIRGFRIELGEIENALTSHAQVSDAVVLARDSAAGDKRLVAYAVMNDTDFNAQDESETGSNARQVLIEGLRQHLGNRLPDYMVPAAYVLLASLPLTPNGKVDRKALPEPDASQQQASYVAPRTETEELMCGLWQEVLGIERVGITDNFFQLGGHSLLATRLVARINQTFKVVMPLRAVFQSQTLETLSQAVAQLDAGLSLPPLLSVPRDATLLPSYAQQRLWLLDQIDGGSAHYNMPAALKLEGVLDQDALNLAFTSILERHESLRTCFMEGGDGQPLQVIQTATPFAITLTDMSAYADGERQIKLVELLAEEASQVFDLSCDLMLRAQLLKMAADEHVLLVTMHHIASDGWSMAILINEFSTLYAAFVQGLDNPLPALAIQYADYAHWQRHWLQGEVLDQQLGYWTKQLASLPVAHSLPLDYTRPQMQSFTGATLTSQIGLSATKQLNALCQHTGATLFMGLHAAFSVLLSRYSNETDIVIGSPIANREQIEVAPLIGFFVNTLVLRTDLSGDPSFVAVLAQSKRMLLDAYAHQQVPFEQIVERLQPQRSLRHSPLFQVMLALQNNEEGSLDLPELSLSQIERSAAFSQFDLTLNVREIGRNLLLEWEYNSDLFEANTVTRMAEHFSNLLEDLVHRPHENVFQAKMLSDAERQCLLVNWNNTNNTYPKNLCIHELFEEQVEQQADTVALIFEECQLSYGELNARANQLAHYLIHERKVQPDTLVGICVERSLDMIVAMLGILKAGAAYLPLDPEYPAARLAYMITDAQLSTIITQTHLQGQTSVSKENALCLDQSDVIQALQRQPKSNISTRQLGLQEQHLAYVIYTSGSTGNPKGVMISHSNLVNLVCAVRERYELGSGDAVLQFSTINFDMSAEDIFGTLSSGGRLILRSDLWPLDPEGFWQACARANATVLDLPTAYWHELASDLNASIPECIRHISIGGEQVNRALITAWYQKERADQLTLLNVYGPTECTIDASFADIVDANCGIGDALPNVRLYVLNRQLELCPLGVAGELHIGGAGLARGYLNRPDLSAEKFIQNPFFNEDDTASSTRLYKTGDLVHRRSDGVLDYLGRIDHQVKIRGFRIELGEIENALTSHQKITGAVVMAKQTLTGDLQLVAYVVVDKISTATISQDADHAAQASAQLIELLRQYLALSLPDYMLPAVFMLLEKFPLMPNGKVDRNALPEPDITQQQTVYAGPRNEIERRLCDIWQEVLCIEKIGIDDNFFQLGGHSLLAMRLVAQINKCFDITLPLKTLFQCEDVAAMAVAIEKMTTLQKLQNLKNDVENNMENEW